MSRIAKHPKYGVVDKQRAWELFAEITKHRFFYHVLTIPVISDKEYDDLIAELRVINETTEIPELLSVIDSPSGKKKKDYPLYPEYINEMKSLIYNKIISI